MNRESQRNNSILEPDIQDPFVDVESDFDVDDEDENEEDNQDD